MPVGRGGADASQPRGVGEGEPGRPPLPGQPQRRPPPGLFQIAVMIAARGAALFLAPAHVKDVYMSRTQRSPGALVLAELESKLWIVVLTRFLDANRYPLRS